MLSNKLRGIYQLLLCSLKVLDYLLVLLQALISALENTKGKCFCLEEDMEHRTGSN